MTKNYQPTHFSASGIPKYSELETIIFVDLNIYYEAGFSEAVTVSLSKIQKRCVVHSGGFLVHETYLVQNVRPFGTKEIP